MVFHEKEVVARRADAIQEEGEITPKVADLVKRTKEMKKQVNQLNLSRSCKHIFKSIKRDTQMSLKNQIN